MIWTRKLAALGTPRVLLGEGIEGTSLIRRFRQLGDDGKPQEIEPLFLPPRPCTTRDAEVMAVDQAKANGYRRMQLARGDWPMIDVRPATSFIEAISA